MEMCTNNTTTFIDSIKDYITKDFLRFNYITCEGYYRKKIETKDFILRSKLIVFKSEKPRFRVIVKNIGDKDIYYKISLLDEIPENFKIDRYLEKLRLKINYAKQISHMKIRNEPIMFDIDKAEDKFNNLYYENKNKNTNKAFSRRRA